MLQKAMIALLAVALIGLSPSGELVAAGLADTALAAVDGTVVDGAVAGADRVLER